MANIARVKKDGTLRIKDTINERLPVIQNGLVAHYPLDSKAGMIDVVRGAGTSNNSESNMNILDAMSNSWRDPSYWNAYVTWDSTEQAITSTTQYGGSYTSNYIRIDTSKSYYLEADVKSLNGTGATLYYGYRFYDANFNEIGISSHYGTFDYTGASGYMVPTTWTHLRNSGCGGVPKTGEGDGGSTVFHTGTKYVTILILWNYSSNPDKTWLKNLRLTTSNADTSNLVFTEEGVAVQEGTTNLSAQPSPAFSNWAGFSGTSTSFIAPNGHKGIFLNAITGGGCQWKTDTGWISVTPSTTYTVSSKIKASNIGAVSGNFFYIREYYSIGSGQIREYGIFNAANIRKLDNGYSLTWASFTPASNCTAVLIQGYEYDGNQTIACYDMQVEQHPYPTSIVTSSTSPGRLQLPIPVFSFPFSVSIIVKNQLRNSQYSDVGETSVGYPISWWDVNGYYKGILGQMGRANASFNLDSFRITCIARATSYDIYFDDTPVALGAAYYNNEPPPFTVPFSFGTRNSEESTGRFGGIYSNASFYNRELTLSEIKTLIGEGLKFNTTNTVTSLILERPVMPSDAWHFPLASNTKDTSLTISASSETNTVYEDNAIWVGTSVTNMIGNVNMNIWDKNGSGQPIIGSTKPTEITGILVDDVASNTRLSVGYINISPNTNYTLSTRLLRLSGTPTFRWQLQAYNASSGYLSTIWTQALGNFTQDIGGWQSVSNTFSFADSSTAKVFPWFQDGEDYVTYTHSYILKNPMMSNKMFYVPYVNGTRGASSLTFNLNSSIGLDWSSEWTVCYWKKPIGTFTDNFSGYNIESLGCNSNSVGGDYTWWGKENGGNAIAVAGYSFNPSDYFNKWQFVYLRKTGTTLQYKIFFDNGDTTTWSKTGPTASNAYVTQYGYDLKLGGWDNDNPTNTFFRDLVVLKRSASDAEIMGIYKQFSIYRTKVYDKNTIEIAL